MELKNKRVLVVGLGKSGLAAARFLKARGARVTVSDARPATLIAELSDLLDQGFMVEAGSHGLLTFRRQDLIVVSPGVPMSTPELAQVRAMGAHIIGELELGAMFLQGSVVGITGSNGKTTTTSLVGKIFEDAGLPTLVGGNIGFPVTAMVEESVRLSHSREHGQDAGSSATPQNGKKKSGDGEKESGDGEKESGDGQDAGSSATPQNGKKKSGESGDGDHRSDVVNVIEVSSFQLETVEAFKPRIAVVLNLTPDHLDRHGTFENYAAAKERIFAKQGAGDALVLNADDPVVQGMAARAKSEVFWFSATKIVRRGTFVRDGVVMWVEKEGGVSEPVMPVSEITLRGAHNVENVLAAVCVARLAGVAAETIRGSVAGFKAVEHRLEFVRELEGVRYYNDSKATNVDATIKAVEAFGGGIWLILGGKDKDSDYRVLAPLVRERVNTVITIGSAAEKIERQLAGVVKIERAETLQRAVAFAQAGASAGDTVLLAPACASFDQFKNYEERGRVFKELVQAL